MNSRLPRVCSLLAVLLGGCTDAINSKGFELPVLPYGVANISSFRFEWPQRSLQEVKTRVEALAQCLTGKQVLTDSSFTTAGWHAPFPTNPKLMVRYSANTDTITIADFEAALSKSATDVGPVAAQAVMNSVFSAMVNKQLIAAEHYNLSGARVGIDKTVNVHQTLGKLSEYKNEYRFTMIRSVNGIDVPRSGIVIGIRPDGSASSLRFGGPTINSQYVNGIEIPVGAGANILPTVSIGTIRQRFAADFDPQGTAVIDGEKLVYDVALGAPSAIVEPIYAIIYHRRQPASGLVGFRQRIGYSITNIAASPIVM